MMLFLMAAWGDCSSSLAIWRMDFLVSSSCCKHSLPVRVAQNQVWIKLGTLTWVCYIKSIVLFASFSTTQFWVIYSKNGGGGDFIMQTRQRTTRYPNTQLNLKNNIHVRVAMVCCRYMHMHIQWPASLVPRFYKCLGMRLVESHLSYPNCQNNDIANTFPSSQLLFIYTCTFKHRMRFHACIILESTCTYMYSAINVCVYYPVWCSRVPWAWERGRAAWDQTAEKWRWT